MTTYSETYTSKTGLEGNLCLVRRKGGVMSLVGYVPCGMQDFPEVFCNGTIEDCRKAYKQARKTMCAWFHCDGPTSK